MATYIKSENHPRKPTSMAGELVPIGAAHPEDAYMFETTALQAGWTHSGNANHSFLHLEAS